MRTLLKVVGGLVALALLAGGGAFLYAKSKLAEALERTPETHEVDFPVPFPLSEAEIEALRKERAAAQAEAKAEAKAENEEEGEAEPGGEDVQGDVQTGAETGGEAADTAEAEAPDPLEGVDLAAVALRRARARGDHLVNARYGCVECHGKNFGGGVMVDDPAFGRFLGPNITLGKGSKTLEYEVADWDRIVRHGVRANGHPGIMPSEDFQRMSDQELSDIIAYIRAQPPVDNEVPAVEYGPISTMLVGFGALPLSVDKVADHQAAHAKYPPKAAPSATFGAHLIGVCTGCHRNDLEGGPIVQGDPAWPPARNLTPHEEGLAGWTYEQFVTALRDGVRPDGSELRMPMTIMKPYAANMTDTELQALFAYIQSVEPKPTPK